MRLTESGLTAKQSGHFHFFGVGFTLNLGKSQNAAKNQAMAAAGA
jgi:hypothetical protein